MLAKDNNRVDVRASAKPLPLKSEGEDAYNSAPPGPGEKKALLELANTQRLRHNQPHSSKVPSVLGDHISKSHEDRVNKMLEAVEDGNLDSNILKDSHSPMQDYNGRNNNNDGGDDSDDHDEERNW